jgi:hypothetical protein
MATDRGEVAGLREQPDVKPVAGERLHVGGTSAVLDRGEPQI